MMMMLMTMLERGRRSWTVYIYLQDELRVPTGMEMETEYISTKFYFSYHGLILSCIPHLYIEVFQ